MNSVFLRGRIVDKPELKNSKGGFGYCLCNLEVPTGNTKYYIKIVGYERTALEMSKLSLGTEVVIRGVLSSRKDETTETYFTTVTVKEIESCGSLVDTFKQRYGNFEVF